MEPSTVLQKPARPSRWWILATILAGALGALGTIAAAGKGTYDIEPFTIELRAKPAALGATEMACRHAACPVPGHAEAGTHRAPIVFRATVTGLAVDRLTATDRRQLGSPHEMAGFFGERGNEAARAFGIKLALLALAGGAAGGIAVSMGRWQRLLGGAVAGVLTFAVIGLLVYQTYDRDEFLKTRFVADTHTQPTPIPSLPT